MIKKVRPPVEKREADAEAMVSVELVLWARIGNGIILLNHYTF